MSAPAEIRETHSAVVVLFGDRAYKVKKPVDLGFLDFRSVAARRAACHREFVLNRRLTPDVYLEVADVVGSDRVAREHMLVMRRMPDERRLAHLVTSGQDVTRELRAVARLLAAFHATARRAPEVSREAGPVGLRRRWHDNLREALPFRRALIDAGTYDEIGRLAMGFIDGREQFLVDRAARGNAVDGHGDLTAEDIFCLPDGPRVLDCLEFDDRLRWLDVLDDACFLAMDLERMGAAQLGARFVHWYAEFSGTPEVAALIHHYTAYRAFVRAKVAAIRAGQGQAGAADEAQQLATLALGHLRDGEVRLILVGGAPGTGKSTIADAVAETLGATLLRTDTVRGDLYPDPASERYTPAAKAAIYRELLFRARRALECGECVVLDATWTEPGWRRAATEIAALTCSGLVALECRAPVELAAARAQRRLEQEGGTARGASEAGADVAWLLAAARPAWPEAHGIDTTAPAERAIAAALDLVRPPGAPSGCGTGGRQVPDGPGPFVPTGQ